MDTSKTSVQDLQERLALLAEKAARQSRRGQEMLDFTESRRRDDDLEQAS